jgi:hypothetical protein
MCTIPTALYERARAESVAALRAQAGARLAELAAQTQALVPATHPAALAAQLRALDACEAAAWVLHDADDLPDLAGVLVLVRHGVRALEVAAYRAEQALSGDAYEKEDADDDRSAYRSACSTRCTGPRSAGCTGRYAAGPDCPYPHATRA